MSDASKNKTGAKNNPAADTAPAETDVNSKKESQTEAAAPAESETKAADKPKKESPLVLLQKICSKAAAFLERFGLPDMLLVRFITVFFIFSGVNIHRLRIDNVSPVSNWQNFIQSIGIGSTVLMMACLFLTLSVVHDILPKKYRILDQSLAIASIIYFDIEVLWRADDFYLSMGVMLISTVFIYYALGTMKSKKLYNKLPTSAAFIIVMAAAIAVCFFVSLTTITRHKNFGSAAHDFGLFVQMYHSLAENLTAVTTCERDRELSHFYIHSSFIFYVLVPFYKLWPKEETLLIAQAIFAMGGVIPMFLIARRHKMQGVSLVFMSLVYVFCTGLIGPCYYEFHENAFLPTLLMWVLWAVDGKKYVMFYIMSVLVCSVKEDAPLYIVCIGMYLFFRDKGNIRRMHGLIMALLSGGYMLFITNWLTVYGDGQMMTSTRFGSLMIDQDGGFGEIIKNVLLDPGYFFSRFIHEDTLKFFLQVMLPLLFLPFMTKKLSRYLLMLPFIIMNLVVGAGYGYAANIGFQYIFGPACLLIYMSIINLEDLGLNKKHDLPILAGAASIALTFGTMSQNIGSYISNKENRDYFDALDEMLDSVPQDAVVAVDTFLLPHIADRDQVYIFDNGDINLVKDDFDGNEVVNIDASSLIDPERYDFFILPVGNELYNNALPLFERNGITLYDDCQGRVQIFVSPYYHGLYE